MNVELNHAIVWVRDKAASAEFLAGRGVYFEDPDGHNMELLTRAE